MNQIYLGPIHQHRMSRESNLQQQFLKVVKPVANFIILVLMALLVISMILGTTHLIVLFYDIVASPDPYFGLVNVEDLYTIFSVLLILLVGYELFKSIILIVKHEDIPVKSILKIAAIALANKVITLNIKSIDINVLFGLSSLLIALGIAFFFFDKEKDA